MPLVLLWSMDVLLRMPENGVNYAEYVVIQRGFASASATQSSWHVTVFYGRLPRQSLISSHAATFCYVSFCSKSNHWRYPLHQCLQEISRCLVMWEIIASFHFLLTDKNHSLAFSSMAVSQDPTSAKRVAPWLLALMNVSSIMSSS